MAERLFQPPTVSTWEIAATTLFSEPSGGGIVRRLRDRGQLKMAMLRRALIGLLILIAALLPADAEPLKRVASGSGVYPAVVVSLGIEAVYDLQTSGTGPRISPTKIPGVDALPTGASYDTTNHRVILEGTYVGRRRTFSGWCMRCVNAYIEVTQPGWTISDNYLGASKDSSGNLNVFNYGLKLSGGNSIDGDANSNVIIEYNEYDGYDSGTRAYYGTAAIGMSSKVKGWKALNNRLKNMGGDGITGRGDNVEVAWNYITVGGKKVGAHYDTLQFYDGDALHYHHNFTDQFPEANSHGRTNAPRLEAFPSNTAVTNALIEYNYIPNGEVLDGDGSPQWYLFSVSKQTPIGTRVSGNRFNNNAVSFRNAIVHPDTTGASGTGNRKIADNTVIPDFSK
jgi:hypothetical protein